jgi:uncharacterized protein YbjT (DUF2867 family)
MKKAIIVGATGLIGRYLLDFILQSEDYDRVTALVRSPIMVKSKKLTFIETDFKKLDGLNPEINGDCLFICIGSTMSKAGSKEAFLKIDYDIPVDIASIAHKNGVQKCIVVSSLGADANSSNFYLHTKGKMEQALEKLGFNNTVFMRPSLLFGARNEFRFGELIGKFFMKIIGPLFLGPLKKYKGIEAKTVAKAMLIASIQPNSGIKKYESNEIELLVK